MVKRRLTVPPVPAGTAHGRFGAGAGPTFCLTVVGDSTAAGCGVRSHRSAMVGNLCALVGDATSRPVEWRVIARPGATSSRIRHRMLAAVPDGQHGTVLMAGVNDIVSGRAPEEWADDIWAVIQTLHERSERVVVTAVPPLAAFPALPARLGRALELRGERYNAVTASLCDRLPRVSFATFDPRSFDDPFMFAADGFHPSDLGYERWAPVVAARLVSRGFAT